jgi:hypothetical protein
MVDSLSESLRAEKLNANFDINHGWRRERETAARYWSHSELRERRLPPCVCGIQKKKKKREKEKKRKRKKKKRRNKKKEYYLINPA